MSRLIYFVAVSLFLPCAGIRLKANQREGYPLPVPWEIGRLSGQGKIGALDLSQDGKTLYALTWESGSRGWNLASGESIAVPPEEEAKLKPMRDHSNDGSPRPRPACRHRKGSMAKTVRKPRTPSTTLAALEKLFGPVLPGKDAPEKTISVFQEFTSTKKYKLIGKPGILEGAIWHLHTVIPIVPAKIKGVISGILEEGKQHDPQRQQLFPASHRGNVRGR